MRISTRVNLVKNQFIFLLCFCTTYCFGQKKLTDSRTGSVYTYIYKINDDALLKLYQHPDVYPDDKILQHPVDSIKTGKTYMDNKLQPGNYFKIYADQDLMQYSLVEKHTAYMHLLNDGKKQTILFTDREGNVIKNAMVRCNNRTITVYGHSGIYQLPSAGKKGEILQIDYQGVANFYKLGSYSPKPVIFSGRWFQTSWYKVKDLFKKNNYKTYQNRQQQDLKYTGFMIFNKPKYKPNDTVRFKAYIFNTKTKNPLTLPTLLVKVSKNYNTNDDKQIATVNSYRTGAYEYSFVLTDSLDLELDENYKVNLEDPAKFMPADKNDDDKDDEGNKKHIIYFSGNFRYEEYELKSTKFTMRTDTNENSPGVPLNVYLKAIDENGLPVPDGRVSLTVRTGNVSYYKDKHLFIPDTLWQHDVQLDPLGETKVTLPDSIFPKANISYTIDADFYNSSNEHRSDEKYLDYNSDPLQIKNALSGDNLKFSALQLGKSVPLKVKISGIVAIGDTIFNKTVMLPYSIKLNPAIQQYEVETDNNDETFEMNRYESNLTVDGSRTSDSVFFKVNNSRDLHFWYSIYQGNKLLDNGEADSLNYKRHTDYKGNILCTVHYFWAGQSYSANKNLPLMDKLLNVRVSQPFSVFPGQEVTTGITITDNKGKPVSGADVTAWALTSKFENYNSPFVPYFGKTYPYQRFRAPLNHIQLKDNWNAELNWARWGHEMGLDSIEYYKFTHIDTIYRASENLNKDDTTTQIAPFVVDKGRIIPVHVLYIDEKPVYFSQAEQLQRYSFRVDSGRHNIRMRTLNDDIVLRNIYVAKGKKLILSVRDTVANPRILITKMPDTLNAYEAGLINKYMIKVENTFINKLATLTQSNGILALNPELSLDKNSYNYRYIRNSFGEEILAGPLSDNIAIYNIQGEKPRAFLTEPDYVYTFLPGLLKQKSILGAYPFNKGLWNGKEVTDYKQYTLNQTALDTLWQDYMDLRSQNSPLFRNEDINSSVTGSLQIGFDRNSDKYFIKNIIVYKYNDPDFIRIYQGSERNLDNLEKGRYRVLILLKKGEYVLAENIEVKPNGKNYYEIGIIPKPKDAVSAKIDSIINSRVNAFDNKDSDIENDALKLKETFNEKYLNNNNFTSMIYGIITDKEGPLPGASVQVKGTKYGTTTDANGKFRLNAPAKGTLLVRFVGNMTQEFPIVSGKNYRIKMTENGHELDEVSVVGYGTVRRADLTASVVNISEGLEGKVAGLQVTLAGRLPGFFSQQSGAGGTADASDFYIRGTSTLNGQDQPLIVVDGTIMNYDDLQKLNVNEIENISILKDAAATAIYGSQGAHGVLLVITKKKSLADKAANVAGQGEGNIRKNFSDYAYWQPKLTTDANGKASFTTVFPDDITSWRTFVVAINGTQSTGINESLIKSFKPLSASFIAPPFAVQGDSLSAIGKVMNYNAVPEKLTRNFSYNGDLLKQDTFTVTNSKIDTLHFTAALADSLTFKYFIKKADGYFDGEERKIPVIKQGVEETKGVFAVLKNDTTVKLDVDSSLGKVTVHAETSLLPTLVEETDRLRDYKYLCNEQLASKLKGLLVEKRIKAYLNEPFDHNKNIEDVIKLINENGGQQGLWGWWKSTDNELWISLHVVEALLAAHSDGYAINLDNQKIIDYLVYQMESYKGQDKVTCLQLLYALHAKVDYKTYIQDDEKEYLAEEHPSVYDHFRILLLKQQAGIAVNTDELLKTMHKTLFGNVYWGEDNYRFFDNSVQLSLLAYKIFRNEGKHPGMLEKIRGYLLEQRHDGGWRNTYESSLILETILPDVLVGDKQIKAPQLKLSGGITATVDKFPYTSTFTGTSLTIDKTGKLPVYITGYQQYCNSDPQKVSNDFTVDTWFERNGNKITKLKGGQQVQLKAQVSAHGNGDFVMIEVPIPAGCSYESKEQSWQNNEVHREYFKEKVSIFCRKLKQGTYTFTIDLMPRFGGDYTLNPAKAELMYFPVFYGREGMEKIVIGD
jgi:TonB-dependent SusC/RagA subfamily outer membrane receptor